MDRPPRFGPRLRHRSAPNGPALAAGACPPPRCAVTVPGSSATTMTVPTMKASSTDFEMRGDIRRHSIALPARAGATLCGFSLCALRFLRVDYSLLGPPRGHDHELFGINATPPEDPTR